MNDLDVSGNEQVGTICEKLLRMFEMDINFSGVLLQLLTLLRRTWFMRGSLYVKLTALDTAGMPLRCATCAQLRVYQRVPRSAAGRRDSCRETLWHATSPACCCSC